MKRLCASHPNPRTGKAIGSLPTFDFVDALQGEADIIQPSEQ
jgi:hypothetical protein